MFGEDLSKNTIWDAFYTKRPSLPPSKKLKFFLKKNWYFFPKNTFLIIFGNSQAVLPFEVHSEKILPNLAILIFFKDFFEKKHLVYRKNNFWSFWELSSKKSFERHL